MKRHAPRDQAKSGDSTPARVQVVLAGLRRGAEAVRTCLWNSGNRRGNLPQGLKPHFSGPVNVGAEAPTPQ
jgi:hypothetical protein